MWRLLALGVCLGLALLGCEVRREIVARERTAAGGASGGTAAGAEGGAGVGGELARDPPRFANPTPVDDLNDPDAKDQDPSLTGDQLEIFFFSDRSGSEDIWTATREAPEASWDPPVPVPELNSDSIEQNPTISRDGLRIWFYSRREPLGIYFAERPSRGEPFGAPEPLPIESPTSEGFPIAPSLDVAELRMAISIGNADLRDLYEIVRPSLAGSWGPPALLSGVNSDLADSTPFLIDDGRELLFHSGRAGAGDLFWAYREAPGLPVVRVEPLDDLNDPATFDSHPHLTVDRRHVYWGSDRSGNTDIYVAEAR
ncbi:MAG TPA: hypothetical protein PLU22_21080 [Polyangiaceae bacterium]|nr:hypothetical protein [Polyangiaceae bacterium]